MTAAAKALPCRKTHFSRATTLREFRKKYQAELPHLRYFSQRHDVQLGANLHEDRYI
jgi:hypothetical protein